MNKKTIVVNFLGRKLLYAYEITKAIAEAGNDVYAIISSYNYNINDWKKIPNIHIIAIPTYNNRFEFIYRYILFKVFYILMIKKYFKSINIDYVYSPMVQPFTQLVNNIFKKEIIVSTLHDPISHSGAGKSYEKYVNKVISKSDIVIILSNLYKEYVCSKFDKRNDQVIVAKHGIFDYYFDLNKEYNLRNYDQNKINFLFFGRIEKYKGLDILGKTYELLNKQYEDRFTLTIAGNGDFKPYAHYFKGKSNCFVDNRWIDDKEITNYFYGPNIVVLLPYTDATQSGIIPIAMVFEDLVVASDVGGISEQMENNKTGILIKDLTCEKLYEVLTDIINDYSSKKYLSDNAKIYIDELRWSNIANKMLIDIDYSIKMSKN